MNSVVLIGRLTRDPELRRTANGTPVASFTLAINRNFSSQSDERQADFIPCVVWNKAAESTARYCQKGSLVGVDGRLQSRTYENQDGRKVNVIEAICESVQFINTWSSQNQGTVAQNGMNVNKYSNNGKGAPQSENWNYNNTATNDASIDDLAILDDDIQF